MDRDRWSRSAVWLLRLLAGAWLLAWVTNRSLVRVEGPSMLPTLAPGQRVVTVPASVPGLLRRGCVVVAEDPRSAERVIVKRVARLDRDGVWLEGDNPSLSTDSRAFGAVPRSAVRRVVVARLPAAR